MHEAMSDAEVDAWLAHNVMEWRPVGVLSDGPSHWEDRQGKYPAAIKSWKPTRDRNHLSEVLAKVPEELRAEVLHRIPYTESQMDWQWSLLTADPLTVATAIYQALNNKQETRDDE